MTDPWSEGAAEIARRKTEERRKAAEETTAAEEKRLAEAAATREAEEKAHQEMRAAMTEGEAALAKFMYERGQHAQRLLQACGAHVMIGAKRGGGHYESVFLHGSGLRYEVGSGGSYNATPNRNEVATYEKAVYMFARHGEGKGNPELVRNIVTWLTAQVDKHNQR